MDFSCLLTLIWEAGRERKARTVALDFVEGDAATQAVVEYKGQYSLEAVPNNTLDSCAVEGHNHANGVRGLFVRLHISSECYDRRCTQVVDSLPREIVRTKGEKKVACTIYHILFA